MQCNAIIKKDGLPVADGGLSPMVDLDVLRKFVGKCSTVYAWFGRWPGVEIMFIETRAGHATLCRWRLVDKARTFMQDCYICRGRYIDADNVKLFIHD